MDSYFTNAADRQCKGWVLHGHPHSCFFRYHTFVSGRVKSTWKARSVHSREPSTALHVISPGPKHHQVSPLECRPAAIVFLSSPGWAERRDARQPQSVLWWAENKPHSFKDRIPASDQLWYIFPVATYSLISAGKKPWSRAHALPSVHVNGHPGVSREKRNTELRRWSQ